MWKKIAVYNIRLVTVPNFHSEQIDFMIDVDLSCFIPVPPLTEKLFQGK